VHLIGYAFAIRTGHGEWKSRARERRGRQVVLLCGAVSLYLQLVPKQCSGVLTIWLPSGSTVLLPEESNAHDYHDHSIDYRGDDGRGPDGLLVNLGRHGEVEVGQWEVSMSRGFTLRKFGESIADTWYSQRFDCNYDHEGREDVHCWAVKPSYTQAIAMRMC
jgi:hypothetical protein